MSKIKSKTPGVYYRGPHQYQVKIRRNGASVNETFETLEQAARHRTIMLGRITGGEFVDKSRERRTTLATVIERYLEEETPQKKGRRQETCRLNAWLKTPLASYSVAAIEPVDIADWIKCRVKEGKAPSTISNSVNLLSAVFRKSREWGYRVDNPCQHVARPPARPGRVVRLSEDDCAALIDACEQGPFWLPFTVKLALTTAMRQGEIRRLRWEFISDKTLHLPETKNGEARDVPLTAAATDVIREMRANLPRRADGWVFGHPDKMSNEGGFTENQVQQAFADAVRRAVKERAIPHVTFHDLKHASCTRLALYEKDIFKLRRLTGHKTLSVLDRYVNPTSEEVADSVREGEARHQRKKTRQQIQRAA